MNFFISILDALIISFVFLCGIFSAFMALIWNFPSEIREKVFLILDCFIKRPYFSNFWFALAIIFFWIVLLSLIFRRKKKPIFKSDIVLRTKDGNEIRLSNKAVIDFISKIILSIDGIEATNVEALTDETHLKIVFKIKITIWEGSSYPDINQKIQNLVRERLAKDMGILKISSINVSLEKIIPLTPPKDALSEEV